MGLRTHATVSIAASAAEVFAWLVEPAKLTAWLGGAGGMPEDTSLLHEGWSTPSTMVTPGGSRPINTTITDYRPPLRMSMTVTYDGGRSVSSYTLVERPGLTDVTVDADTDFAAADTSAVDAGLAGQPVLLRWLVHGWLSVMKWWVARGAFDAMTEPAMNTALEESMTKLKALVEARAV